MWISARSSISDESVEHSVRTEKNHSSIVIPPITWFGDFEQNFFRARVPNWNAVPTSAGPTVKFADPNLSYSISNPGVIDIKSTVCSEFWVKCQSQKPSFVGQTCGHVNSALNSCVARGRGGSAPCPAGAPPQTRGGIATRMKLSSAPDHRWVFAPNLAGALPQTPLFGRRPTGVWGGAQAGFWGEAPTT